MAELDGKALTAVGVGVLFVWSGIKGWSILGAAGDIVKGGKPNQSTLIPLTTGETPDSGGIVGGSGESVATVALQYQGHPYKFGGAPGPNAENPWDCSSFVNYVVGVRLKGAIPGNGPGKYQGTTHGPPTGVWAVWSGLQKITRDAVTAGDVIVWLGHMGIAISNAQMISALNPRETTKVTSIDGHGNGPLLTYGRLTWANPSAV